MSLEKIDALLKRLSEAAWAPAGHTAYQDHEVTFCAKKVIRVRADDDPEVESKAVQHELERFLKKNGMEFVSPDDPAVKGT